MYRGHISHSPILDEIEVHSPGCTTDAELAEVHHEERKAEASATEITALILAERWPLVIDNVPASSANSLAPADTHTPRTIRNNLTHPIAGSISGAFAGTNERSAHPTPSLDIAKGTLLERFQPPIPNYPEQPASAAISPSPVAAGSRHIGTSIPAAR